LGDLRDHRGARQVTRRGPLVEDLAADVDCRIVAGTEAVADVLLEAIDGGVTASGQISSRWQGECRRCLRRVDGELVAEVRELFRRGGGGDDGTYALGEEHVNLREMVLDSLFSALPVLPLCREDCRGICSQCGADLNTGPCDCQEPEPDPRWAGLRALADVRSSAGRDAVSDGQSALGEGPTADGD
jgi:uncharacterized protein